MRKEKRMKKEIKRIVASSLMALSFGALSVGTTFALFTSEAKTQVNIQAGKIALDAPVTITRAWELNNVPMTENADFDWSNSIGGSITKDANNIIHLDKIAPGDGAEFTFDVDNHLTNINTKVRLVAKLSGDLAPALQVEAKAGDTRVFAFKGARTSYSPWEEVLVGANPTAFKVTVEFPNGENAHDNLFQDKSAELILGYEVVQGNAQADEVLELINTKLATAAFETSANNTMFDALQDLSAAQKSAVQTEGYVWGVESDQFYDLDETPIQAYKFFKMYESMPSTQTYSIYAMGNGWTEVNNLTVGFDAGETSTITSINYDRHDATVAREVVIRTNGGTLTINAPIDEVIHYGQSDYVDIIAVKTSSYEERGTTSLIKVAKGNVALNDESNVGEIHFAKTGDEFTNIKVSLEDGAQLPDLSRDPVGTSALDNVLICEVVTSGTSEYYWLNAKGTIEDGEVLLSSTLTGEKTAASAENSTAVAIANAKIGDTVTDNGAEVKAASEMTPEELVEATASGASKTFAEIGSKEELKAFRDAWNTGKLAAGTFKLTANIDISGENWYPIGTWKFPFNGTFDGNQKMINGLYANSVDAEHQGIYSNGDTVGFGEAYGFFGIVGGGAVTVQNMTLANVNINIYNGKDVGAVIGYAPSLSKFKAANASGNDHFIDVDKWTDASGVGTHAIKLSGITVNGSIKGSSSVGGIAGKLYTSGKVEVLSCTNSASVDGTSNTSGIVGYIHYSSDITVDGCRNTGTIKLTGGAGIVHLNDLGGKKITNNTNTGNIIYKAAYSKTSNNSYSWDFIATGAHNSYAYAEYHGNTNTGKFYVQENENPEDTKGVLIVDAGETVTINSPSVYGDIVVNGTLNVSADTTVYGCLWVESSGSLNVNAALEVTGTQGTLNLKNSSLTVGTNGSITAWYITVPDNFTLTNNGTIRVRVSTNDANATSNGLKRNNLTVVNNGTFIADSNMFYGDGLHFTNNGIYSGNMLLTGSATVINTVNGRYEANNGNGIDFRGGSGSFTNYADAPFGTSFDGVSIWVAGTYIIEGCNAHLGAGVTNLELTHEGNIWTATNK